MRETTTADAHKLCSCTRVLRPSDAYLFIGKLRVKRGESIEVKGRESHRGKPCCPCRRSLRDDESDLEESGDKVPSSDGNRALIRLVSGRPLHSVWETHTIFPLNGNDLIQEYNCFTWRCLQKVSVDILAPMSGKLLPTLLRKSSICGFFFLMYHRCADWKI